MILLYLLNAPTWAGSRAELTGLAGARSAPEASVEYPEEWEREFDPSSLLAVLGEVESGDGEGAWVGLQGAAWTYLQDEDADRVYGEPRAGWRYQGERGLEVDLAGRYVADWVLSMPTSSSTRGEALGRVGVRREGTWLGGSVTLLDRSYPLLPEWSFRSAEVGLDGEVELPGIRTRAELAGAIQGNWGFLDLAEEALHPVSGYQGRFRAGLAWGGRWMDLSLRYRLYLAEEGEEEETLRPQFTPIGDYSDDADALSGGGFIQHRVELAWAAEVGAWTLTASALGRDRTSESVRRSASFARTVHGQATLERTLSPRWSLGGTVGSSAASLVDEQSYLDLYGWLSLTHRWEAPSDL